MNVISKHLDELICPKCKMPMVYMDVNFDRAQTILPMQIPITQRQPYCDNCGFTTEYKIAGYALDSEFAKFLCFYRIKYD